MTTTRSSAPPTQPRQIPPLENGDHLTRDEFERRYEATPGLKKAELIEGVVYMPPPVRADGHSSPHADLIGWLVVYRAATPGVRVDDNATIRLDLDNEPQPDAAVMIRATHGGQAVVSPDDYIEGAPEFVAEVSASTASIDLNTKFRVYRRNKVREYLVWRVLDHEIDWFILRGSDYDRLKPSPDGVYRSETFPGLWLDTRAMLRQDIDAVLKFLQQGLAAPEHAEFVSRLQRANNSRP
jgi:Uma2 family endonuclease